MNKTSVSMRWMTAVSAAVLVLFLAALVSLGTENAPDSRIAPSETQTQEIDAAPYRIVSEWKGRVAVFLPNREEPEQVLDTRLASLPKEEQERLKAGVSVEDSRSLKRLLENYSS